MVFYWFLCSCTSSMELEYSTFSNSHFRNFNINWFSWFTEAADEMIPVSCIRCDRVATVIIETVADTQASPLCTECKDIVLTSHTLNIWRVKETIQQEETKKDSSLENTL